MKITVENCLFLFICSFVIVLPGFPQIGAIGLGISIALAIIINLKNKTFSGFSNNFLLLSSFYLLHLIGIFYSNNIDFAMLDIQIKASFLLVPLCFDKLFLNANQVQIIKRSFIFGCLWYSIFLLVKAYIDFTAVGAMNRFFYTDFSPNQHVAYLTMYIALSCFFIIDEIKNKIQVNNKHVIIGILLLAFFYIIMILLSSRTAIFAAMFSISLYLLFAFKSSIKIKRSLLLSGLNAIVLIFLFKLITGSQNRFETPIVEESNTITKSKSTENSSTVLKNVRFTLWTSALQLFKEHPILGVGTGDIKDELIKKYKSQNFTEGITFNLNAHNQFFQTLATLGIFGFISITLIFFIPIYNAIKNRHYLFLCFLIMVLINCFTESVFEKQAGVLFFCFFFIFLQKQSDIKPMY